MPSPKIKDVIRYQIEAIVSFTALLIVVGALNIYWNHFRWYWDLLFYLTVCILSMLLGRKIGMRLRRTVSEEEQIVVEDKLLGLDKEPSKGWYFFP